ncbi:hypothetical protein AtEden1_Chr5g0134191 [Arabidopsis thaliana]
MYSLCEYDQINMSHVRFNHNHNHTSDIHYSILKCSGGPHDSPMPVSVFKLNRRLNQCARRNYQFTTRTLTGLFN